MAELALTMPKMSMTMEEGTMVTWLKRVGDAVRSGEPVCEVATDKVDMEVESPFDGTLARIVAQPDDIVRIGEPIAYIATDDDDLLGGLFGDDGEAAAPDTPAAATVGGAPVAAAAVRAATAADWPAAVPAARREAQRRGIDLGTITPTGPWNTIRVADVDAVASAPEPGHPSAGAAPYAAAAPSADAVQSADVADDAGARRRLRLRRRVAAVMAESAAVPQFTAYADLDLTALADVRKTQLGGAGWTAILVRAHALALRTLPDLCRFWANGDLTANESIGVALAVDTPAGLVAPVVRDADRLPLPDVARQIGEVVARTRQDALTPDDLSGSTTVFSNLGGMGVGGFNALLTPPHATALSAGAVRHAVTALDAETFGIRLVCTVGITVDHRVADGADAARYLTALQHALGDVPGLVDSRPATR